MAITRTNRGYSIPKPVINQAHMAGLVDNDWKLTDLLEAIKMATPITHKKGNRRFEEFIFNIRGIEVLGVSRAKCPDCMDTKLIEVFNECYHCNGKGCRKCSKGLIRTHIRCQFCK